jgi:hypothetical protein
MPRTADLKRLTLRDSLWGDAEKLVLKPDEKGWWKAPRTLPLVLTLTRDKRITGNLDCSAVYLELWSRDFGQGIVEIFDEAEHAFAAGYVGDRAVRSWRERVRKLAEADFLRIARKPNREIGYVLLLDPYTVVQALRDKEKIGDTWWSFFIARLQAVGVSLPMQESAPLLDLSPMTG